MLRKYIIGEMEALRGLAQNGGLPATAHLLGTAILAAGEEHMIFCHPEVDDRAPVLKKRPSQQTEGRTLDRTD